MTSEQLEVARAERMRQNGPGTLTFEDARTWIEETGLCHFLPRRQSAVAPSFVEAVGGHPDATPDPKRIAIAEEMLVRLEAENVAVRLNLLGQPGEHPDYVVASWVLPYVYALRGDRDWRRNPQLTGSRAVSPLAVQAYKLLEAGDATIPHLKQALGREVTDAAVLRAITELWQQLRIIPVIPAPGQTAKWQLLRHRYQKAIAEGASTSQVTAISVLASIFLQAVIAATMEEVEIFLSPLTARSKVREVLRGLVATRQVHTISLGHAPHFYVAGTLPDFTAIPSVYAPGVGYSSFGFNGGDRAPFATPSRLAEPAHSPEPPEQEFVGESASLRSPERKPEATGNGRSSAARPHSRPTLHTRDRKRHPQPTNGNRMTRRGGEARVPGTAGSRWSKSLTSHSNGNGKSNGSHAPRTGENGSGSGRSAKTSGTGWTRRNGHHAHAKNGKPLGKANGGGRKEGRIEARSSRKPAFTGGKTGKTKRLGFRTRRAQGSKKRG